MNWLGWLTIGFFIGGCFGVFMMSLMSIASQSDDCMMAERQYDKE